MFFFNFSCFSFYFSIRLSFDKNKNHFLEFLRLKNFLHNKSAAEQQVSGGDFFGDNWHRKTTLLRKTKLLSEKCSLLGWRKNNYFLKSLSQLHFFYFFNLVKRGPTFGLTKCELKHFAKKPKMLGAEQKKKSKLNFSFGRHQFFSWTIKTFLSFYT